MLAVVPGGLAGCGSQSGQRAQTGATGADPPVPAAPGSSGARGTPVGAAPVTPTAAAPPDLAARLRTLPATTTQVVIVHADSYASTYATVEAYQKSGVTWQSLSPPMAARVGERGFTDTPTEGVHYAYHRLVTGDYWDENVSSPTYNTFVHGTNPGGASEPLWQSPTAYSYFAFITYNVPAVPGKGSGIFLHQSLGKFTAGCVALPRDDLLRVLTWLDPAADPRIVIAPDSVLGRY
jgi:L,D-peptidoglycan transpeptidase YkuD (ErfK/YbiS/YcfS/YnhG family)